MVTTYFRKIWQWWPYLLTSFFLIAQVITNEVPGDSKVFFEAGMNIRRGISPWFKSEDAINFQYLNGPLFSIFCYLLSWLGSYGMYIFTCIFSISIVPLCVLYTTRLLGLSFDPKSSAGLSSFFALTFAFRANLEYGQFVAPFIFLLLLILVAYKSPRITLCKDLFIGLGLVVLLDFKPHIFLIWVLILMYPTRNFVKLGFLFGSAFELMLVKLISGNFWPYEWLIRLMDRARGSDGLSGYYNIHTLLSYTKVPFIFGFIFTISSVLTFIIFCAKHVPSASFIFLVSFLTFFPLMHPQDFLFVFLIVFSILFKSKKSLGGYLIIGFSFVWSTNIYVLFICLFVIISTYCATFTAKVSKKDFWYICMLLLPMLLIQISEMFKISTNTYRVTINILSIFLAYTFFVMNFGVTRVQKFFKTSSGT